MKGNFFLFLLLLKTVISVHCNEKKTNVSNFKRAKTFEAMKMLTECPIPEKSHRTERVMEISYRKNHESKKQAL